MTDPTTPPELRAVVYLDTMGHLWSADRDRLHALADAIGMKRAWFQERPRLYHYDLIAESKRLAAVRAGAVRVTPKRLVALIRENDHA